MSSILPFVQANFQTICKHMKSGGISIIPTDTVFGFSADPSNKNSIFQIQEAKKRNSKKPFLLLMPNIEVANEFVEFSDFALRFAEKVWPGPCTIILPRKKNILPDFFPAQKTLAIRIPGNKKLLDFLNNFWKKPLISTSVNLSNQDEINDINRIKKQFSSVMDLIICTDKAVKTGLVSTVVEIKNNNINVLRDGMLSRNIINTLASEIL